MANKICGIGKIKIMETKLIETPNGTIAVIKSDRPLITDGQSALDFAVNEGAYLIAVNKAAIAGFFQTPR